ncbi:PREDICTED: putative late blight resistance protein homolog R1B-14 [Ipomoea nil]|uniref:putative late blight resistance protein homolog R1B-14 n=1 Tax=Ipomoea nil TaxID=35883 RepID=UPI000900F96A|nr:PREDICTED: putative late blight resistance protein homolog R1B-14 [Ipomoea nil]
MAYVGVASLRATMEFEIQRPTPRVLPDDLQQMRTLLQNLAILQAFLDKYYIKAHEDAEIKQVEVNIKSFALESENKLEIQLRNILLAKDAKRKEDACRELHRSIGEISTQLGELLRIVNARDDSLADSLADPSKHPSDQDTTTSPLTQQREEMVGHREELKDIMEKLGRDCDERQVISIWGMGGIGKTTLARTLYDDPVTNRFDVRAWTTVSQQYEGKQIITALLRCIKTMTPEEIKNATKDELAEQLQKLLKGRRYLIVVDDVWSSEAWDELQRCFPKDCKGSCVLLTTRHKEVAEYTHSEKKDPYGLSLLNDKDSWVLFSRKPKLKQRLSESKFEAAGKGIVEQCKGLPLSIVVVAGILIGKELLDDWMNIKKELSLILTVDEQCKKIAALSYKHLPPNLKPCFLHLGVFPEDSEMPIKNLIRLWIAEGFVKASGKRLEDAALEYLQDLVGRSIILVRNWSSNGLIKTCSMHDILHEFCVSEAEDENLLYAGSMRRFRREQTTNVGTEGDGRTVKHEGFRWLSFWPNYGNVYFCYNLDKSRSLSFLHRDAIPTLIGQCLPSNLLRVLDLIQLPPLSNGIFRSLRGLVLLRYMDVTLDEHLSPHELTNIVSKIQNLQTLVVSLKMSSSSNGTHLPYEIWESPQLRHVEVSYSLSVDPPTEVKEGLHTLHWLSLDHCTEEVFSRISKVKKLGIICGCESNLDGIKSENLNNLNRLRELEKLMIAFRKGSSLGLQNLDCLPKCLNIKKLKLKRTCLPWSEISAISMLPHLEVLKLKEASSESNWEGTDRSFRKLKSLFLEAKNLISWQLNEEEQFPCLERLVLKRCSSLVVIPTDFECIIPLKSIEIKNCSPSVLESAHSVNENRQDLYGYEAIVIRHVDQIEEGVDDDDDDDDDDEEEEEE